MLVCVFLCHLHTRPRVQRASGFPCALLFFSEGGHRRKARAHRAARSRICVCNESGYCEERSVRVDIRYATQWPTGVGNAVVSSHATGAEPPNGVLQLTSASPTPAQPPAPAMAGGTPDLRRDRDHSQHPDRADHGPFRARLDHRRPRARPDRSRLRACDDHGHLGHALRAAGADRRQRAVAGEGADGYRRARHQFSDDLQPRGRRKGRAQRALSAARRAAVGPVPRAVPLGRLDGRLHGDRRRRHDLHDHHRACRGGQPHRRDHGDARHRRRRDRPRRPRHLHRQARPASTTPKCWR